VIVGRERIAELLPHGSGMVLLDRILECGKQTIHCETDSHQAPDNPLRRRGRLPAMAAIEYAAQASALHAALSDARPPGGGAVLGGAKDVVLSVSDLSSLQGALSVKATLLLAQDNGAVYSFAIASQSGGAVAEGRFTVMYR
jgi:predicted hotdog family 3-hydroxylacyl-ACP dehydratase